MKGSEIQKERPCKLLWMLWFDEKSISKVHGYGDNKIRTHKSLREENIIWNLIESSLYENIIKKWPLILFWYAKKWIKISSKLLFKFSPHFYLKTSLSVSYINDAWLWLFSCHEEIMRGIVKCEYCVWLLLKLMSWFIFVRTQLVVIWFQLCIIRVWL